MVVRIAGSSLRCLSIVSSSRLRRRRRRCLLVLVWPVAVVDVVVIDAFVGPDPLEAVAVVVVVVFAIVRDMILVDDCAVS